MIVARSLLHFLALSASLNQYPNPQVVVIAGSERKDEKVLETSRYQLFVKAVTAKLKSEDPTATQTDRMKAIGLLWRAMSIDERNQIIAAQRRLDFGRITAVVGCVVELVVRWWGV